MTFAFSLAENPRETPSQETFSWSDSGKLIYVIVELELKTKIN